MAEAKSPVDVVSKGVQDLDKEITCPVCHEYFEDPKLLPCGHFYCKKCIDAVVRQSGRGRPFPCPECRKPTSLPQNDSSKLPSAFFVKRIKDIHSSFTTKPSAEGRKSTQPQAQSSSSSGTHRHSVKPHQPPPSQPSQVQPSGGCGFIVFSPRKPVCTSQEKENRRVYHHHTKTTSPSHCLDSRGSKPKTAAPPPVHGAQGQGQGHSKANHRRQVVEDRSVAKAPKSTKPSPSGGCKSATSSSSHYKSQDKAGKEKRHVPSHHHKKTASPSSHDVASCGSKPKTAPSVHGAPNKSQCHDQPKAGHTERKPVATAPQASTKKTVVHIHVHNPPQSRNPREDRRKPVADHRRHASHGPPANRHTQQSRSSCNVTININPTKSTPARHQQSGRVKRHK